MLRGKARYRYYLASAAVGDGIRLITRTVCSLEVALKFHVALVAIKQKTAFGTGSFDVRFRNALQTSLQEFGLDAKSMGLKFIVSLKALWLKTPLRTPAYSVPSGLDKGLKAFERLQEARGPARRNYVLRSAAPGEVEGHWERLQGTYLSVMMEAGCQEQDVRARLEILKSEHRARHEDLALLSASS